MPKRKNSGSRRLFWLGGLCGLLAGGFFVYMMKRPPAKPMLSFLVGVKPIQSGIQASDDNQVTTWEIPGRLSQIEQEAAGELLPQDGWQPPVLRQTSPRIWQIVRVKLPNGDFQFSRWVFLRSGPNKVRVERSLGPIGVHIPSGR